MTELLAGSTMPYAAYRAMMATRLVALDKEPGTRPIGIGEIFRRLAAKTLLKSKGLMATHACGSSNLCAGLSAGIEGALHAMQFTPAVAMQAAEEAMASEAVNQTDDGPEVDSSSAEPTTPPAMGEVAPGAGDHNAAQTAPDPPTAPTVTQLAPGTKAASTPEPVMDVYQTLPGASLEEPEVAPPPSIPTQEDDPFVKLMLDAKNGFGKLSRKAMLWTVRHRWAGGCRFAFNCYRHQSQSIVRRRGKPCYVILSEEGIIQGDPLAMILYGITLVPLAKQLKEAVPDLIHSWYADDAALAGDSSRIRKAVRLLQQWGPQRGYFLEADKSIAVVPDAYRDRAELILREFNFTFLDGHRYVGGFIGADSARDVWLAEKIQGWVFGVHELAKVAKRYPQTAYAGMAFSLQAEWQYLQRVTEGVGEHFAPIEEAIAGVFLPALFQLKKEEIASMRSLLSLSVRWGGLGLPNPVQSARTSFDTSTAVTSMLTAALLKQEPHALDVGLYLKSNATARKAARAEREQQNEIRFDELSADADVPTKCRLDRSRECGSWLTTMPNTFNGTVLSAEEFRDSLRLRFGFQPKGLPAMCDGCGAKFGVEHALNCKAGGMVSLRHDSVSAEWQQMCVSAFSPGAVSDEPLIPISQDRERLVAPVPASQLPPATRGDSSVYGFWKRSTKAIFDVRITNLEHGQQRGQQASKMLAKHEKEKKAKHLDRCLEARCQFTPLVFSCDGMMGLEAKAASKRLASKLSAKWRRPYSQLCAYVRSRLSMAVARGTSLCLRGCRDRDPLLRNPAPQWDSGTGLALY